MASLLALDGLDPQAEIRLYINCAAASPYAVTAILDVLRSLRAPVSTLALGYCGGAASVLLAGGTKGRRCAMPNARIMLVQPSGGAAGSADEVNITTRELNRTMNVMYTCAWPGAARGGGEKGRAGARAFVAGCAGHRRGSRRCRNRAPAC